MAIAHAHASGMGGIRTSGDLVARMQMTRGMRLNDAKNYVAGKLGVSLEDLTDEVLMDEVRGDLDIGRPHSFAGKAKGMEAKFRIAELLDIEINSVKRFREKAHL
jgi:hypothetical protein